jgi:hypothetical protein
MPDYPSLHLVLSPGANHKIISNWGQYYLLYTQAIISFALIEFDYVAEGQILLFVGGCGS